MGQKLISRKEDPVLHDLGRWMDFRRVTYEDVMEEWGLSRGSVYKRLAGKQRLGIKKLLLVLDRLGLSAEEFSHGVKTGFHPELLLHDIVKEDTDQVSNFRKLHLKSPPRRVYADEELREMADGLETLRFRDPKKAHDQAREILRSSEVEPDVEAEAWGVMGVLHRFRGRPSVTAFCLGNALRAGGSEQTKARNYTRFAMLLLYHVGDAELALEAMSKAKDFYWSCCDVVGLGKTMVDEGVIMGTNGLYREAIAAHQAALGFLPDEHVNYRFSAYQGVAIAAAYLGDVDRAFRWLRRAAEALSSAETGYLTSSLLWLKGELALLLGDHRAALDYFFSVKGRYLHLEVGAVEIAMISLRIAKAYFLQGNTKELRRTLESILLRLGDVERANRVLGAVLSEFLREAARGRVSAEVLEEIYRKLRGGSEAGPPLLPSKLSACD